MQHVRESLGRDPTDTEEAIISAEWSEHCSYKSSKMYIRTIPNKAPHVISEDMDSGVIDVGDGYVVTAHIESHNHPSALDPFGGAATGVGGILRDIVSAGTRPIAILDGLHFGDISTDTHAAWLLGGAVRGISHYGNCMGIPNIGGEIGFDECYTKYALVDVAAIGFGKRDRLIHNRADPGDHVVLLGGPTGYDGVGGSQFASAQMDTQDRSAVQIPDPFMEKMVMEVILQVRPHLKALKDLGGGGLACALSETADSLQVGITAHLNNVHTRNSDMTPAEIVISESQERMLAVVDDSGLSFLTQACSKFHVPISVIGSIDDTDTLRVYHNNDVVAQLPVRLAAHAPPIMWPDRPAITPESPFTPPCTDIVQVLYKMLQMPDCADKRYIYSQYDQEVGIRTVRRPGLDASVLRLDNGRYLAVSLSSNPRHCWYNPYHGTMGCFEESCRNVACVGATPVAMLDHLQFGSPEDPETFWSFKESVRALSDYATHTGIPCIGGKVSLYNETDSGPIKPSPAIMILGLSDVNHRPSQPAPGHKIILIGQTQNECGGSIYHDIIQYTGGHCPRLNLDASLRNMEAARRLATNDMYIHDASRGGLGMAIMRMCLESETGCNIDLRSISDVIPARVALFSESHSRYLVSTPPDRLDDTLAMLQNTDAPYSVVGSFGGDTITFSDGKHQYDVDIEKAGKIWSESLERMILHG
ncbi:MAG: phosphoribosylformylglycinamidine synthase subunit PurL [Cenarchaeum sp. SB0663_bin_5]|nr:phosphoribosylformylglycinamidine synthase subunit PurL [Cenarchaeum sp. SB0663_bin_5]MYH03500.1 phosphoribosylformylglycinamidine synthase subunit PurL [Cenarchaeum sp. SB0675_bin_21]MYL10650.1 phosphoribosylformylglycinamidine synthase subunit PurL [Cenarchaeum sp. SB0669_bin_11]